MSGQLLDLSRNSDPLLSVPEVADLDEFLKHSIYLSKLGKRRYIISGIEPLTGPNKPTI